MIATAVVLLALAGAPPQAAAPSAAPVEVVAQNRVSEAERRAATQPGYGRAADAHAPAGGEKEEIDFMHHVQDSREWELPGKTIHFPPPGTYRVGPIDFTPTKFVVMLAIAGVLTLVTLLGGAALAGRAEPGVTAGKRHNMIEAMVLFVRNEVVMPNIGHGGEKFAPFICTLFFFIMFANLLGIIPYMGSATASISVTAALALITFVVVEVGAIIAMGPAHWLHTVWMKPKGMGAVAGTGMAIFLLPLEVLSKIVRPVALAIRLMANMTAGHIVLLAMISLIFVFGSWAVVAGPLFMAVCITFLEIFVAFLQAFIFAILTSVFIGLVRHAH
ncbi:MAG TPA: F0F1 ATP synthase subunit A [Longimicrobium sp.]|jgi:F-type H+-transporting ATPase subunit a|nr:F0F1 ATP synthase subunit A [Longimicrobium sp.]